MGLKEIFYYEAIEFNNKYRKGSFFWKIFDFVYLVFKMSLKIILGNNLKNKVLGIIKTEKITSLAHLPDGNKILFRIEDRGIIREFFGMNVYDEIKTPKKGIILDIGGHIGLFSITFSKKIGKEGKIYAFEPFRDSYNLFKKNLIINDFRGVKLYNNAISEKKGKMRLYLHKYSAANSLNAESDNYVIIESETLINFVKREKIKRIELIKLDVEGAEYEIIKNSKEVLKNTDAIILELHPDILSKKQINEVEMILKKLKFKRKVIYKSEPLMIYYYK